MTVQEFITECENYQYSREYYDLYKEASELEVAEVWLECQAASSYYEENFNEFTDSYLIEAASKDKVTDVTEGLKAKEAGFFKKIGNRIARIWNAIISFFKRIWNKIRGKDEELTEAIKEAVENNEEQVLKRIADHVANLKAKGIMYEPKNGKFNSGAKKIQGLYKALKKLNLNEKQQEVISQLIGGTFVYRAVGATGDAVSLDDLIKIGNTYTQYALSSPDTVAGAINNAQATARANGIMISFVGIGSAIEKIERVKTNIVDADTVVNDKAKADGKKSDLAKLVAKMNSMMAATMKLYQLAAENLTKMLNMINKELGKAVKADGKKNKKETKKDSSGASQSDVYDGFGF